MSSIFKKISLLVLLLLYTSVVVAKETMNTISEMTEAFRGVSVSQTQQTPQEETVLPSKIPPKAQSFKLLRQKSNLLKRLKRVNSNSNLASFESNFNIFSEEEIARFKQVSLSKLDLNFCGITQINSKALMQACPEQQQPSSLTSTKFPRHIDPYLVVRTDVAQLETIEKIDYFTLKQYLDNESITFPCLKLLYIIHRDENFCLQHTIKLLTQFPIPSLVELYIECFPRERIGSLESLKAFHPDLRKIELYLVKFFDCHQRKAIYKAHVIQLKS